MAEVVCLETRRRTDALNRAETCATLYRRLKFDPSNVVFAPKFHQAARAFVKARDVDATPVDVKEAS